MNTGKLFSFQYQVYNRLKKTLNQIASLQFGQTTDFSVRQNAISQSISPDVGLTAI